jgi:hypothetical protein
MAVATPGMLESLDKILVGILSTQLPSTVIFLRINKLFDILKAEMKLSSTVGIH